MTEREAQDILLGKHPIDALYARIELLRPNGNRVLSITVDATRPFSWPFHPIDSIAASGETWLEGFTYSPVISARTPTLA